MMIYRKYMLMLPIAAASLALVGCDGSSTSTGVSAPGTQLIEPVNVTQAELQVTGMT